MEPYSCRCDSNDALEAVALEAPALFQRLDAAKDGRPTVPISAFNSDNISNRYARSNGYDEQLVLLMSLGVINLVAYIGRSSYSLESSLG